MVQRRLRRLFMIFPIALLALVSMPTSAAAADHRTVKAYDDCETDSFDAAIGPGTCVGDGETTFDDFISQLIKNGNVPNEAAKDWDFSRPRFDIDKGGVITVVNEGGEFHTFSEVPNFDQGGCVQDINIIFGLEVGDACDDLTVFQRTGVAPGGKLTVKSLKPGVHHFQCLIHPWMQSTAVVKR